MPNVPHNRRTRGTHRTSTRSSHDHAGYLAPLAGGSNLADQQGIDGVVGPGDIPPGTVDGGALVPGTVDLTPFASSIRPVILVAADPTLPDDSYPAGSFIYRTDTNVLKRTDDGTTWVALVGPSDIQANSITAGQIAAGAIATDELAAGAVTTAKLATGEITLYDEYGQESLTPAGFGAVWQRFLQSGYLNGDFAAPTGTIANNIDNTTNPLPSWSFVQRSGTAITAKVVADTSQASGYRVDFTVASGAAGDDSYIEQIIPVNASISRTYSQKPYASCIVSSTAVTLEIYVSCTYLERDGTPIGTEEDTSIPWNIPPVSALVPFELGQATIPTSNFNPIAPSNAYYLRVRYGVRRGAAGTTVTGTGSIYDTYVVRGEPRLHLPDISTPGNGIISFWLDNGVGLLGAPDSGGTTLSLSSWPLIEMGESIAFGTNTFPSSPADGDLVWRTDIRMMFFYDSANSQWLSTQKFRADMTAAVGEAATFTQYGVVATQNLDGSDIWIEDYGVSFYVNGGTALSGSHKWVGVIGKTNSANADTALATVNIDSGSSSVWRNTSGAIDALRGTTWYNFRVIWTKTGTPGPLFATVFITYRIKAT